METTVDSCAPERRAWSGDHTFRLRQMVEWLGDRKGIAAQRPWPSGWKKQSRIANRLDCGTLSRR